MLKVLLMHTSDLTSGVTFFLILNCTISGGIRLPSFHDTLWIYPNVLCDVRFIECCFFLPCCCVILLNVISQVELNSWVCSLPPAAFTWERLATHSTVSCSLKFLLTYEVTSYTCLDFTDFIYDIVADCSDNVPTRYLVNDACVLSGKPLVSASALRMEGQVRYFHCANQHPSLPEFIFFCFCL